MTSRRVPTPLEALGKGLAAGLLGTCVMTAYQLLVQKLRTGEVSFTGTTGEEQSWEETPVPAQLAQRVAKGVLGKELPLARAGLVTNAVHFSYGTCWGAVYGVVRGSRPLEPLAGGVGFGLGVWAASYVFLVPLGLYRPFWEYGAKTTALDVSYHLVYGLGVACSWELVDRAGSAAA